MAHARAGQRRAGPHRLRARCPCSVPGATRSAVLTRRAHGAGEVAWDPAAGVLEARRSRASTRSCTWRASPSRRAGRRRARRSSARAAWPGRGCWPSASRRSSGRRACSSRSRRSASTATAATRCSTSRARRARASCPRSCRAWEEAAAPAAARGIRVVHPRLGLVLTPRGGALARLLPLFRLGLGGPLGDGRAWWSWVALEDVLAVAGARARATRACAGPSTWSRPAR